MLAPLTFVLMQFFCAVLLSWWGNWLNLISWRKAQAEHWTERARMLWPVRVSAGLSVFFLPPILSSVQGALVPDIPNWWLANMVAAFLGAVLGCYALDREIFPQLDFKNWWHQSVAGWGIRFGIWGMLLLGCVFMPTEMGWQMSLVIGLYLLIHFAIQWGLILGYMRLVRFLTPADERLSRIVNSTAASMNVSIRGLWQLNGVLANAFAFPTTRELVFSKRLLEVCSDEEVAAICVHELAHLKEGKWVLTGRLIGSLAFFPLIFINPCVHYLGPLGILLPYIGLFLIARFARWLSLRMEKQADSLALSEQTNDGVYARALEKIYRENQLPAVNVNDKKTHPHLYDRMIAAGVTPDYPRPQKPKRITIIGWIYSFALGFAFVFWVSHFRA